MTKVMSEYESIRNEIISLEEQERNVWIYMYVSFITLFILGIERTHYLFLITYVILIPFQVVINRYEWSITKLSTYIRLFYEIDDGALNWESMHVFNDYKEFYKKINSGIIGITRNMGVTQLGFLATACFVVFLLKERYVQGVFSLSFLDIFLVIISFILFFLVVIINKDYKKNYTEELEVVIQKYKDSLGDK